MNDQNKPEAGETEGTGESHARAASASSGVAAQESGEDTIEAAKGAAQAAVHAAKETQEGAAEAASSVAQQAKSLASDMVGKAKRSTSEASDRLLGAVEQQKAAGADQVREVADAIQRAADALDEKIPQAARYVRLAAQELENASEAINRRDVGEIFEVVQDFARRRPAAFLGATALAGFATARFLMASAQGRQDRRPDRDWPDDSGAISGRSGGSSSKTSASAAGSNWAAEVPVSSGPSTASGDPGGVSPQAPGFETKAGDAGENKT